MLCEAKELLGECRLRLRITGLDSMNIGKPQIMGFVQEVVAVASAFQVVVPQTDAAIELGGEADKMFYFNGSLEERMKGVCAVGTG